MSDSAKLISTNSIQSTFSVQASKVTKHSKPKRLSPLSLRLSELERAELERLADGQSLGGYIRWRLFDKSNLSNKPQIQRPSIHDYKSLAKVLRALASADIIRTVGDLHAACDGGSLVLSNEAEYALRQACVDIHFMRKNLIVSLGLKAEVNHDPQR